MSEQTIKELREEAWIGDAILLLYARLRVLREHGRINAEALKLLTSNCFIGTFASATENEAAIGRRFTEGGLDAAMAWIHENLEPLFARQERNRQGAAGGSKTARATARKQTRRRR